MTKPTERRLIMRFKKNGMKPLRVAKTMAFLREDTNCDNVDKLYDRSKKLSECPSCGTLSYGGICQCKL